jgi:hypothetical protein
MYTTIYDGATAITFGQKLNYASQSYKASRAYGWAPYVPALTGNVVLLDWCNSTALAETYA